MALQRPSAPSQRGVSTVTVLLLLAIAAGVYVAYVHVPVRLDAYNFDRELVKIVRGAYQEMRGPDEERVRMEIERAAKAHNIVIDPNYSLDVEVETDPEPQVRVRFAYLQNYRYPVIDKAYVRVTRVDRVQKRGD